MALASIASLLKRIKSLFAQERAEPHQRPGDKHVRMKYEQVLRDIDAMDLPKEEKRELRDRAEEILRR